MKAIFLLHLLCLSHTELYCTQKEKTHYFSTFNWTVLLIYYHMLCTVNCNLKGGKGKMREVLLVVAVEVLMPWTRDWWPTLDDDDDGHWFITASLGWPPDSLTLFHSSLLSSIQFCSVCLSVFFTTLTALKSSSSTATSMALVYFLALTHTTHFTDNELQLRGDDAQRPLLWVSSLAFF